MSNLNPQQIIIAHPLDPSFPAQGGGIRYLMNILHTFIEQGWTASVIGTQAGQPVPSSKWQHLALSPESKNAFLGWGRYLLMLYLRLPFMRLPFPAVIITHRMDCMLAFVLFKPRLPKVMVSAAPAYYVRLNLSSLYKTFGWLYHLAERICVNGVDCIVPTDPATQTYYTQRYPQACVTECVPSAIDLSLFRLTPKDEARARLGWPLTTPVVLFVGRLAKVKNLPLLICAFAKVEQVMPAAKLYIVGGGESEAEIKLFVAQTCRHIMFEGDISPQKVAAYYAAADILVLCSIEEGSPTVIKEALASGTAVVSVDVGDAALVLAGDADLGQIVAANENSLAQGIINYLTRGKDNDAVREKRRAAVQIYSIERTGTRLIEICNQASVVKSDKK